MDFDALEMTALNTFIGILLGLITFYYFYFIPITINVVFLMTATTLWKATDDFFKVFIHSFDSNSIQVYDKEHIAQTDSDDETQLFDACDIHVSKRNTKFAEFLKNYTKLKTLASALNKALGGLFLSSPISICFYYAIDLKSILASAGWTTQIMVYYLLIQNTVMFILAAEICRKVC